MRSPVEERLKGPCYSFYFTSRTAVTKVWSITVHRSFMINITIERAHVPYTKFCKSNDNYITINEGLNGHFCPTCDYTIDYFCGHVHMVSTYSKYNKATVSVKSTIVNVPNPTMMKATYTVHIVGYAYKWSYDLYDVYVGTYTRGWPKYTNDTAPLPDAFTINIPPSKAFIQDKLFSFIWYVANSILEHKQIKQIHITISTFLWFSRWPALQ